MEWWILYLYENLRSNKWKKRGLAIIPNKYCLAFGRSFLNQTGALLHVYTDGSVLLSHGGMEMGQGLHTKMIQVLPLVQPPSSYTYKHSCSSLLVRTRGYIQLYTGFSHGDAVHHITVYLLELYPQVCSHCLNLPMDRIHISETSSDKVPNTSPTAASVSTDLNGMAVKSCCDQIMERLKPFREADPEAGWNKWVSWKWRHSYVA